ACTLLRCASVQFAGAKEEIRLSEPQVLRFPKSGIDSAAGKDTKTAGNSDSRLGWLRRSFARYGKDFRSPHPLDNVQRRRAPISHVRRPDLGTFRGPSGRSEETVCHGFA